MSLFSNMLISMYKSCSLLFVDSNRFFFTTNIPLTHSLPVLTITITNSLLFTCVLSTVVHCYTVQNSASVFCLCFCRPPPPPLISRFLSPLSPALKVVSLLSLNVFQIISFTHLRTCVRRLRCRHRHRPSIVVIHYITRRKLHL